MIEITFRQKEDALKLSECVRKKQASFYENGMLLAKEDHYIVRFSSNQLEMVKQVLRQFILFEKRDDWLREIMSQLFCFTDPGEQQQIIDIIRSLLKGNRDELLPLIKGVEIEENLTATIDDMLMSNASFSFDSFIKFRLRSFMANLERYVEVAIDEYKMEQEYQMFIQMLRDFIQNRQAKMERLHLLLKGDVIFYDRYLQEMSRADIAKLVDRKLLFNHPVYVDSVTIAPLLSIAPNEIYMYTNETENPLVRTIQNIFEERVQLYPYQSFFKQKNILIKRYEQT